MKIFIKLFIIVLVIASNIFAGDPSRKGTTGAEQLLIPVGARSIATSGAFISSVTGLEAIYYNPAGLNVAMKNEAMFNYMTYLADINVSYFAAGAVLGDLGSVALSVSTMDFGDIPVTTNDSPDGTGSTFSPSFITVGATYSKIITDRVAVGVNAKVVSESFSNVSANAVAIDFGVQYRFQNGISLGAVVKNIGTKMKYSGSGLRYKSNIPGAYPGSRPGVSEVTAESFEIPSYFSLSLGYKYNFNEQNSLNMASSFINNNSFEDQLKVGMEYSFMDIFFARAGYDMYLQNTDESIYGLTFGAGVNYSFTDGIGVSFDYAYRDVDEFPEPNHVFTVKLNLK